MWCRRPAPRLTPTIPLVGYPANESFGPTEDRRSIIVLNRFRWEHHAPVLSRIDLADGLRVPWQYDRDAIEERVGRPVGLIRLIRGPKRPCRYLPLVILEEQEKRGPKRVLWMLDSKTGDLTGPQSLPWRFDGNAFDFECTFEGITLHASDDGRLLSYYTDVTGDPKPPRIVVYDTTKKRSIARRQPRSCEMPVGFDARGNVILANSYRVLRWQAPFTNDWEVVYSLQKRQ